MNLEKYRKSRELLERSKNVLAGGVSSEFRKFNHPHAIFYTYGKGSRIYDVDGNEYVDFTLSQGPLILGHCHPVVDQAVSEYARSGQLFAGQHMRELLLAETLSRLIPSAEAMRFCLDGSEAVQTAFRLARAKTKRPKFLRFEGHYHGWLDNVAHGLSAPTPDALGARENPQVFPWSAGLARGAHDEFITLPWNDLALLRKTVTARHNEIAAIITEPVMCNSGCIMPAEGFLAGVRELCDEFGITLIFDEVITGFRMGLGGAQEYFGVVPDLSIFAKAMGSGHPISAIVGKHDWIDLMATGEVVHAGTMNSCNTTVAAALATIEVLENDDPYRRMFAYGNQLMDGLRKLADQHGHPVLVQGPGPMFNISFTSLPVIRDFRDTLQTDKAKLKAFIAGMHDEGVRVIGRGLWYISAVHTEDDIAFALEKAEAVFRRL